MEEKEVLHFTQAFGIDQPDEELDFFDTNLSYDTPVFVDPFLLRKSRVQEEKDLFERFGDFFRYAYDKAVTAQGSPKEVKKIEELLTFKEPREVWLGYAENSNEGSGPGLIFVKNLVKFFLNSTARRLVKEDSLYPDGKFNPLALEVFVDKLGQDGISDITVNLIMDYLILYTQRICKEYGIKLSKLPVNNDGFDFDPDENNWRGGGIYELPENPLKPGEAVILVPKRLLRAEQTAVEKYQSNIRYVLNADSDLSRKFSDFLEKRTDEVTSDDIRRLILDDNSVLKKYIEYLEEKETRPYDFSEDILYFYANKKYRDYFKGLPIDNNIKDGKDLVIRVNNLIDLFEEEISQKDGWKSVWRFEGTEPKSAAREVVIGRIFRGMGNAYFSLFPSVHFLPESETGNGPLDFQVIYDSFKVAIELKKIENSAPTGTPPLPAYRHGLERQLPDYIKRIKGDYGIYLTIQHFSLENRPLNHHDQRVDELKELAKEIESQLQADVSNFRALYCRNIKALPKKSASKL